MPSPDDKTATLSSNLVAVCRLHVRLWRENDMSAFQVVTDLEAACAEIERLTAELAETMKEHTTMLQQVLDLRAAIVWHNNRSEMAGLRNWKIDLSLTEQPVETTDPL